MPEWFMSMTTSDWLLFLFAVGALWFVVDYGAFSPWWKHPIGWVVMVYGVSVVLLMFLIVYGVVVGERVDEWARQIVGFLLCVGITGKILILHVSRHEGRIERRRTRAQAAEAASEAHSDAQTPFWPEPHVSHDGKGDQKASESDSRLVSSVDHDGDGD